jgi:maltose O-acetyltransferase
VTTANNYSSDPDSEHAKMLRGDLYDPRDGQLVAARLRARQLLARFNASAPGSQARELLLRELIPGAGANAYIEPPFACDYGDNITLGANFYCNFDCVILDVAAVTIGRNVLFGPGVHVYAATHPLSFTARRTGLELGAPVEIGDDAWIGGGAIVCPGVRIGARAVIGAGSVVTRDIPDDALAAGNPCRVIRAIGDDGPVRA